MGVSFEKNYIQSLGCEFSVKLVRIDEETKVELAIWDLAGQVKYSNVHPIYFYGTVAAIIVYDVTDLDSYHAVPDWLERFLDLCGYERPIVALVGNKIDLVDETVVNRDDHRALVTRIKIEYADQLSNLIDFQTSAKTGENIDLLFMSLGKIIARTSHAFQKRELNVPMDEVIPGVLHVLFHEIWGPHIMASSPAKMDHCDDKRLMENVARLFSSFDFKTVVDQRIQTGKIPWNEPLGFAYFFAFALDNSKVRGGHELHVLIIIVSPEYVPLATKHEDILTALAHSAMNKIAIQIRLNALPKEMTEFPSEIVAQRIISVLDELRSKCFSAILRV